MANRLGTARGDGIECDVFAPAIRGVGGSLVATGWWSRVGGGNAAAVEEGERARLVDRTDPVRNP
jgi:hypothetical protein